ncbi:glycosyltransferase family 8 protein [Ruminococcus sp. JL13D9]|uniref:glycosyltransferase family 8 protein n=1 Tax=Ruminococcus sp. JL13D9 TaxID=3233381 RepID=UPI00389985A0
MNILISSDKKYLDKYCVMLNSLKRNANDEINVFFLNYRVGKEDMNAFSERLQKEFRMHFFEIDVKNIAFGNYPIGYHLSVETYFRILAQFLLPHELDRVLWLDGDIIILKEISDFYSQSFDGMKYVVCEERINNTEQGKELKKKLGLPKEHVYFNAGVMLMNLESLRKETNAEALMRECFKLKDKVEWFDQDILNILYANQLKYDDYYKYNYQIRYDNTIPKDRLKDIHILHYNAEKKPWDYDVINEASLIYWKAKSRCGKKDKSVCKKTFKGKILETIRELTIYVKGYFSI